MGQAIALLLPEQAGLALSAGFGRQAGTSAGVAVHDQLSTFMAEADVVIDFTLPEATSALAAAAAAHRVPIVVGTTGLDAAQQTALVTAAAHTAVFQARNFSLGVALLAALTERAARVLPTNFDIEITETHHRAKVDAPSGTALLLGEAAARGRGTSLDAVAERGRDGGDCQRTSGAIGFTALRGGTVAGEHTVLYLGPDERIELTHRATNRTIFARGAIAAARWLVGRQPGLYGTDDLVG
jgi:4-hydroxy-tetrahydrodipicolinate reductase